MNAEVVERVNKHLDKAIGLHRDGAFGQAVDAYAETLDLAVSAYGTNHSIVATILGNMGNALQDAECYEEALNCYERALEIDERVFGKNHPAVATDLSYIGSVLRSMDDDKQAAEFYSRALVIDKGVYGPNHPEVALDLQNLGVALASDGAFASGVNCLALALDIDLRTLGPDSPTTSHCVLVLEQATRYVTLPPAPRKVQDIGSLRQSLSLLERRLPVGHAILAALRNVLAYWEPSQDRTY